MNKLRIFYTYLKTKYFNEFNNRKKLVSYQKKKLLTFSNFIFKKSIYYSKLKNENILNLPIIRKKEFMENFDLINIKNIKKKKALEIALNAEKSRNFKSQINDVSIGLSSGTSGNKGIFLVSNEEKDIWAGYILAKARINIFKKNKIAFFLRANNNLYESVTNNNIKFKFYDLLQNFDTHINSLNKYKPNILIAPSSVLVLLAKAKLEQRLNINIEIIYSIAEVLEPQDKNFISNVFNISIGEVYQCTEGFLGITCKFGTIHINEDILIMQKNYINKEQKKFKPIITDFTRKTQPVIRYELDDILTEKKEKCKCGSALLAIESIEGRADDIIYLKNNVNKLVPVFPDYFRRIIITTSDLIEDYYVEQIKENELKIFLEIKKNKIQIQNNVLNNINDFLLNQGINLPKIVFIKKIPELNKGEKKRRVRSKLKL